jgi:diguanylate cyclase (GGDEF)-like protein
MLKRFSPQKLAGFGLVASSLTYLGFGLASQGWMMFVVIALGTLLGCEAGALAGRNLGEFVFGEQGDLLRARLAEAAQGHFHESALELCLGTQTPPAGAAATAAARRDVWAALHLAAFTEGSSGAPCLIVQAQDVTGRRAAEAQLHELAFHDTLTGLPNRRRFMQCLEGAVARALADPHYGYAVMYLDFDRFKLVNDSLGHGAGDALLVQLARRLQARLRPSDVVARLGGDEFALLAERTGPGERADAHEYDVHSLAQRLLESLHEPFEVAGQELQVSASIGITFSRMGYLRAEEVLRDADTAMYKAKADGRARIVLFDGSLHADVSRRLRLEGDLRRALDQGGLSVAYQPVFELQPGPGLERGAARPRGGLRAVEALVRWRHPTLGLLMPAQFLPVAEESGLMSRISDFVLLTACRQVRAWQTSHAAWADLSVSVNVAAQDLAEPGYGARVQAALLASGLRGEHLTLELTEDILMSRVEGALPTLAELRRLGVRVAVDDFGTGYSSLSYLARLPIDMLKIDRSFVSHLSSDADQAAVVRAILHLGQSLRKAIVAEGIESPRQLEQLMSMGCQLGQGHHLAEPLDAAATGELLLRMRAGAPALGALHLH